MTRIPARAFLLAAAALAAFAAGGGCRTSGVAEPVADGTVWLENGIARVAIDPVHGGRVVYFGFAGGRNVLWTHDDPAAAARFIGSYTNWGGDKTWIWPQDGWRAATGRAWPPMMDGVPYDVRERTDRRVTLVSPPFAAFGVRVVRTVALSPRAARLRVTSSLEPLPGAPTGVTARAIAPWTVTQVPQPRRMTVRLGAGAACGRAADLPGQPLPLSIATRPDAAGETPIGSDWSLARKSFFDAGAVAAEWDDVRLELRAARVNPARYERPVDRLQVYASPTNIPALPAGGPAYVELEFTAPPAASGRRELVVDWTLSRLAGSAAAAGGR